METKNNITKIPIPFSETSPDGFLAWMDWSGPDVLRLLRDGKVDEINWGVTDSEQFEKVKKHYYQGRCLCVTGKHPENEDQDRSAMWSP